MTYTPPPLFITDKQKVVNDSARLPVAFRQIERYLGNLHIPTGGGGGSAYASLTGPGQTTTPGDLIQSGGFQVIDYPPAAMDGIFLQEGAGGIYILSGTHGTYTGLSGGVYIEDIGQASSGSHPGYLQIQTDGELHITAGQNTTTSGTRDGMYIANSGHGDPGADGLYITNTGDGGLSLLDRDAGAGTGGSGGLSILESGTGGLTIQNTGASALLITSDNAIGGNINISATMPSTSTTTNPVLSLHAGGGAYASSGQIFLAVDGNATSNPQSALIQLATGDINSPIQFRPFTNASSLTGTAWGVELQVVNPTSGSFPGPQLAMVGTRNVALPALRIHDYTAVSGGVTQSGITIMSDNGNIVVGQAGATGNVSILGHSTTLNNLVTATATALGFFGSAGGSGPVTVSGSRAGNAALASLLTALAGYGLITNSTSP